jgi:hypothetical protein
MRVPCPGSASCSATSNETRLRSIGAFSEILKYSLLRREYSLLRRDPNASTLKIHRLVQAVLKRTSVPESRLLQS